MTKNPAREPVKEESKEAGDTTAEDVGRTERMEKCPAAIWTWRWIDPVPAKEKEALSAMGPVKQAYLLLLLHLVVVYHLQSLKRRRHRRLPGLLS